MGQAAAVIQPSLLRTAMLSCYDKRSYEQGGYSADAAAVSPIVMLTKSSTSKSRLISAGMLQGQHRHRELKSIIMWRIIE